MFGKSFSQYAVERATIHLTCLDERSNDLFILFPPMQGEHSDKDNKNSSDEFIKIYNNEPAEKLAFAAGFSHTICAHFFDGKSHHLDEFIKRVIIKTFNYGFMMNMGKSMNKGFSNAKYTNPEYYKLGCAWAQKSYIEKFVNGKGTIDELLRTHEAKEEYYTERFFDPKVAYETAQRAKITRKEHQAWCNSMIEKLESDFSQNESFSDELINDLHKLEGDNSKLSTSLQVYFFYEDLCFTVSHDKRADIIKCYDPDHENLDTQYDELENREHNNSDAGINFDEATRYEHYLALWQIEKNLPQSKIFSDKFSEEVSSLDLLTDIFPEIKNEELKKAYQDYLFMPDLRFYLEIFGSIHHLFLEQGLKSECAFLVGVHSNEEDIKSYPRYKKYSFFDLKSKILKNNGRFNYAMIDEEFPKFGRTYIYPNLQLGISLQLSNDNEDFEVPTEIIDSELQLSGEVGHEKITKMKTKSDKLCLSQELVSLNHQLKHGYSNSSRMGFKKLEELIEDWESPYYTFASDQKKVYEFIQSSKTKLLDVAKLDSQFSDLTMSNLVVESPGVGDRFWDAIFGIYTDSEDKRSAYFSETGLLYDPFEFHHLKKFKELGLPVNPQLLRKGLGLLPVTVKIALRIERLFLYLSEQHEDQTNFDDLLYDYDEYP